MNSEYMKGFLLTALGVTVLSFDALLIRLIEVHSFSLLFWRGFLLSVTIAIWCRYRHPKLPLFSFDAASVRSAILFTISCIAFVSAINLTAVANVLVIISVTPLFSVLLARVFLGEKSPPITWLAILISLFGIGWVLSDSWHGANLGGDLTALVCGLALSAKFVNDRAASSRNMTPALIISGLLIAAISAIAGEPLSLQGSDWGWMLLLCLAVLPIAYVLITIGPMRIPAAEVGMLMLLETAMGPLWVWAWMQEIPSVNTLQGGALIIGTLFVHGLIQWYTGKKKTHSEV